MAVIRDTKDLGTYIRRIRKARGYTQARLAELAGVGVVYISQLENGKETAEIGKALHLLQLLSVDIEAIDRQNPTERNHPNVAGLRHGQAKQMTDDIPLEDIYLAFPALLGDDGETHVLSAEHPFWYPFGSNGTSEGAGDDSCA